MILFLIAFQPIARADETNWLKDARTLAAVSSLVGKSPDDCVKSRPGFSVCDWELTKEDAVWRELAEAIGTRYRISVVCELPSDDGYRQPGSCRVWIRKRTSFSKALDRGRQILELDESDIHNNAQSEKSHAIEAREILDHARSIRSLSFVLGESPYVCLHRSARHQLCRWRLGNRSIGYEIAAAMIQTGAVITVSCPFDYDGTPLDPDACEFRER